jgi:steroid delta-isomerase-like uncharacterized protein
MSPAETASHDQHTAMTRAEMKQLIEQHLAAEIAGDSAAAVAMYTDDMIHDDVGAPHGPLHGPDAAKGFYDFPSANFTTERMDVNHAWYGDDFCVTEHQCTGTAIGEVLGIPGHGKRISFRILHVWEFKNRLMSRENVWLDSAAIMAQLTA